MYSRRQLKTTAVVSARKEGATFVDEEVGAAEKMKIRTFGLRRCVLESMFVADRNAMRRDHDFWDLSAKIVPSEKSFAKKDLFIS